MATVKPFKGLRPQKELVEKVASPPYDVLSSEEARELAKDNPYSFLHIVKPEIDLPRDIDIYDERVYKKGAENLKKFIEEKILLQDESDFFYIYRQKMGDIVQTGLVCCASVDDYDNDVIKKHEQTRADKEEDRTKHVYTLNANTGPVFLTYRASKNIDSLIEEGKEENPEYHFTSEDGVEHTFWVVKNRELIGEIVEKFKNISTLYVADGHHRSASASRVRKLKMAENKNHTGKEEYNYFLVVIFPHNQLHIMDYNRVVKDLNGLSKEEFLEKIKEKFTLKESEVKKPDKKHKFGMYLDGKWYMLEAREGTFDESDPVKSLDVSILQENLLYPILGIENPRKDKRINFVGGIRGTEELEKLVNSREYKVAFSMYPTSIEELMKIADEGKFMPPKSTWFEPKLRSGLVVHLLD